MRNVFKIWIFATNKDSGKRYRMEWMAAATSGLGAISLVSTNPEVIKALTFFEHRDCWQAEDMGLVYELDIKEVPMAKGAEVSPT